jgi:hypothetical protein
LLRWRTLRATDLLGIAPRQIFHVAQEFASLDMGFKFPAQRAGAVWRAKSPLSAAAQLAIKELRHTARQARADKN